jgi:hypothetical protein
MRGPPKLPTPHNYGAALPSEIRDRGLCGWAVAHCGVDPDLWHPDSSASEAWAQAREWCGVCPVKNPCLRFGAENRHRGVWGGVWMRGRTP